jgi:putative DNA primase/helicase
MSWGSESWKDAAREYHAHNKQEYVEKKAQQGNGQNGKPVLIIDGGELPNVAEKLRDILAKSGMLFDRGFPVRVFMPRDGGFPIASTLTNHSVVRLAHQFCRPVKDGENATLPDRVAGLYLDMVGDWGLPKLVGITSSPLLSNDGGIRAAVGYDRDAGLYCCNIPALSLPNRPTKQQAENALATLRHAFRTFPFADATRSFDSGLGVDIVDPKSPIGMDESGFLTGLMTAVCRQSLWLAPGFLLNAPQISGAGAGKGLLARAISAVAYGIRPRPFTPGNDKHEMDKRIVAELIEATPVIFMDNVNATLLRSNTLASIITERPSGVRELGKSRMIKLEHASFVVLTGNGLTVGEDLARRFIFSRLDPHLEDPEVRPFRQGFLEEMEERRGDLLAAALTIWRWGRQNSLKPGIALGSFEKWGTWVRDPLLALGCQDPVAQIREIKARDPHRQKVAEIYELWWDHHGDASTKASELAEEVKAAIDSQGRGRQFIAKAVEDLAGTRQSGFVLTRQKGEGRKAVATYALKKVSPQGDGLGRHPPHPPHPPARAETLAESTAVADEQNGDAADTPHGMPETSTQHTQSMPADGSTEIATTTIASDTTEGMRGMGGMPSPYSALQDCSRPARSNSFQPLLCNHCGTAGKLNPWNWPGRPDGITLHSSCEAPWFDRERRRR